MHIFLIDFIFQSKCLMVAYKKIQPVMPTTQPHSLVGDKIFTHMQMEELRGLHLPDCENVLTNVDPNGLHNSRPSFFNSRRTDPGTKSFTNAQDKTRENKYLKISSLKTNCTFVDCYQ